MFVATILLNQKLLRWPGVEFKVGLSGLNEHVRIEWDTGEEY